MMIILEPCIERDGFRVLIGSAPLLDGKGQFVIIPPDEAVKASHGSYSSRMYYIVRSMLDPDELKDVTPS